MSFPLSPINGQIAIVNNVTYQFVTAENSWVRTPGNAYANSFTISDTLIVNGSANIGNIYSSHYYWANGTPFVSSSYGNTDVAAYLLVNSTITGLQSNAAYQANLIDVLTGNAATQGSLLDVLVANAAVQSANLASLLSNAGVQADSISSLLSNAIAQESSLTSLVASASSFGSSIISINANLGAYQIWANSSISNLTANAASQATDLSLKSNIASPTFTGTVTIPTLTVNGNITAGNLAATGNLSSANILASGYYWANGAPFVSSNYGDANVTAYLSDYFVYANANAAGQTTALNTLDANVGSYQLWTNANIAASTGQITSLWSNAATQQTQINTLDANLGTATTNISSLQANAAFQANLIDILTGNAATQGSLLDVLVANAAGQSANLTSLLSNAAAQEASLTVLVSNAAIQSSAIDNINANIGAYQIYANANAAAQTTTIGSIDANLGAYQTWANSSITNLQSNAGTQQSSIDSINANVAAANAAIITANTGMKSYVDNQLVSNSYGNANVAVYLPTYTGNLNPGNITASGNIVGGGVRNTASSTPPTNPVVGDTWYDTDTDTLLRYVYDGTSKLWVDISALLVGVTSSTYGDTNVGNYLPTSPVIIGINANVTAANAAIAAANSAMTSNVAAANAAIITANTGMKSYVDGQISSLPTYGNTQVSAYLLIDSTITSLQSNAALQGSILDTLTGNAVSQSNALDALVSNAAAQATTLTTLLSNAASQENSLTSLVSNAATQATLINNKANTAGPIFTGTLASEEINNTGNIYANGYFWGNGDPFLSSNYGDANVSSYIESTTLPNVYAANLWVTSNVASSSGNITVTGNILPSANITYDLGSYNKRWKDLYLSGSTIYLGSSIFTQSNGSMVIIPPPTVEFPNPAGLVISPYGTISTVTTSNGNVTSTVTAANNSSFSNITVSDQATIGNAAVTSIYTDNYKFANGAAFSSGSTYGNTQVTAYLPTHSANVGATNLVPTGNIIQNGWTTYATATKLTIYYNNSPLFSIYTNGNIVAAGDVTAYGSA